jgi:hypothetical protein
MASICTTGQRVQLTDLDLHGPAVASCSVVKGENRVEALRAWEWISAHSSRMRGSGEEGEYRGKGAPTSLPLFLGSFPRLLEQLQCCSIPLSPVAG